MSRVDSSDSLGRQGDPYVSNINIMENLLEQLLSLGFLELPISTTEPEDLPNRQMSEKAREIGKRVRTRVLTRLGVPNIGAFIARERMAKGIRLVDLAREVKIAREVLLHLETNRLEFFELSPQKATDLVQYLTLNPRTVLQYLVNTPLSSTNQRTPASFFRMDIEISEDERAALEYHSQEKATSEHTKKNFEEFLQAFVRELYDRSLLVD